MCLTNIFDHSRAVKDLLKAGIDCYMAKICAHELGIENHHRVNLVEPFKPVRVGSWSVMFFDVVHDVPNFGFVCSTNQESLLYATDTSYIKYRFLGLTHIMIECNFSKKTMAPDLDPVVKRRLYRNHFRLENVLKFLHANDLSRVVEIHLLHCSSRNSDADMFKREVQAATGKPVFIGKE